MAQELELLLKAKNLTDAAFKAVEGHVKSLENASKKSQSGFDKSRQSINAFARASGPSLAAVGKAMAVMAGAAAAAAAGVVLLAKRGAEVANVRRAFEALSGAIGQSGDEILDLTKTATKGLISDMEIMTNANKGLLLGLPITADEMAILGKTAITLGQAMRIGPEQALNDLVTGLGRGSAMILDNLGITVKAKEANEQYAASIGKAVGDLTDAEKKTALYTKALTAARAKLLEIGGINLTFAERLQMVQVGLQNFTDSLGEAIATSPALARGLEVVAGMMQQAFGANQAETVKTLVGIVEGLAIGLLSFAQVGVRAAQFITNAFQGTKAIFNAIFQGLFAGISMANSMLSDLASKASALPVVGAGFEALAGVLRTNADLADSLAFGFGNMKDAALEGAAESNAAFGKTQDILGTIKTAMIAAKDAQLGVNEAVKNSGTVMAEVIPRAQEFTQKIAESYRNLQGELSLIGKVGIDRRITELQIARDKEIDGLKELKGLTVTEYEELAALVNEKYQQMSAAARLGADEILDTMRSLQMELAIANATGLDQQLLQIEAARQKEIDSLVALRARYGEEYEQILALVLEKYDLQIAAATSFGLTVEQLAAQSGFKTREELERTAATAIATYERMAESGKFTANQIQAAWEAAEEAKRAAAGETLQYQLSGHDALVSGAQQVLGVLGERHKSAAIAGALIATYASVAKSLASAPWPFNLVLAAGALAAGLANVSKIRSSSPGYKKGTPGTEFVDFGKSSLETLHGQEAIVTKAQGESLADMLSASVKTASREAATILPFVPRSPVSASNRSGGDAELGDKIAAKIGAALGGLGERIDVHVHLDTREISDDMVRRNKSGLMPIRESSVRRY